MKRQLSTGLALTLAILLIACGPQAPGTTTSGNLLLDTTWQLVSLDSGTPIAGSNITLAFKADTLQGNGGCNTYQGNYAVAGNTVTFNDVYRTEMACMEPDGVMEQELAYFSILERVTQYELENHILRLLDEAGQLLLQFEDASGEQSNQEPVAESTAASVETSNTANNGGEATDGEETGEEASPTPLPVMVLDMPVGYQPVIDQATGISVWIPDSWTYDFPDRGNTVILQSYAPNKYVGGEARDPGDTKCDFTIHPQGTEIGDIVPRNQENPAVTVVAEAEITLRSGQPAQRFEVDSMGLGYVAITLIRERAVSLACYGNPEPFDTIASTLSAMPDSPLAATLELVSPPDDSAVEVVFTITNTSAEGLYLLSWFTPIESVNGDIFKVQRDGHVLDYTGKLVKRGDPLPEDYLWLEGGASYSATVNLAQSYDFSAAGQYTVRFRPPRLSYIAPSLETQTYSVSELGPIWIPCKPISILK